MLWASAKPYWILKIQSYRTSILLKWRILHHQWTQFVSAISLSHLFHFSSLFLNNKSNCIENFFLFLWQAQLTLKISYHKELFWIAEIMKDKYVDRMTVYCSSSILDQELINAVINLQFWLGICKKAIEIIKIFLTLSK